MTTKLLNWASNEGQITKSKLSGGRRAKFLPWLVVMIYNLLRTEGYLGNVGLHLLRRHAFFADRGEENLSQVAQFGFADAVDVGEFRRCLRLAMRHLLQ